MLAQVLLTLAVGCAGGVLFIRLGVPAGGIVGSMLFVSVFNVLTGLALFPWQAKVMAQAIAGAFIAVPVTMAQIRSFRRVIKPAVIVICGMLLGSVLLGLLSARLSGMSLITAFMASATGGIQDIVLMSEDVGADPVQVSVIHVMRALVLLSCCPLLNLRLCSWLERRWPRRYPPPVHQERESAQTIRKPLRGNEGSFLLTLAIAAAAGWLGYFSGMPGGSLVFAMVAVCAFNLRTTGAVMPQGLRRFAQICAGVLIGVGVDMESIQGARTLLLPILVVVVGHILIGVILGQVVYFRTSLDLRTAAFATIPAGVADMALIAEELDGDGAKVTLLQTARLVATVTLFPMVYVWLSGLLA